MWSLGLWTTSYSIRQLVMSFKAKLMYPACLVEHYAEEEVTFNTLEEAKSFERGFYMGVDKFGGDACGYYFEFECDGVKIEEAE